MLLNQKDYDIEHLRIYRKYDMYSPYMSETEMNPEFEDIEFENTIELWDLAYPKNENNGKKNYRYIFTFTRKGVKFTFG